MVKVITIRRKICAHYNHHSLAKICIDGVWIPVVDFPKGCCLNQDHPNYKNPCTLISRLKEAGIEEINER